MVRICPNEEKLKELILYISAKCAGHSKFGATKLNKILFYSDFIAFQCYGCPITGVDYQKLENGPAPRRLLPIEDQMKRDGELAIQVVPLGRNEQHRRVNLRAAKLSMFSADEIAIVDSIIDTFKDLGAGDVSQISHGEMGWKAARMKETIPYSASLLECVPPTDEQIQRAKAVSVECAELLRSIA